MKVTVWRRGATWPSGFLWAADHGADVANLSYGLSTNSSTINNAAQYLRSKGGLAMTRCR